MKVPSEAEELAKRTRDAESGTTSSWSFDCPSSVWLCVGEDDIVGGNDRSATAEQRSSWRAMEQPRDCTACGNVKYCSLQCSQLAEQVGGHREVCGKTMPPASGQPTADPLVDNECAVCLTNDAVQTTFGDDCPDLCLECGKSVCGSCKSDLLHQSALEEEDGEDGAQRCRLERMKCPMCQTPRGPTNDMYQRSMDLLKRRPEGCVPPPHSPHAVSLDFSGSSS